ncbi:prepilin peptidase [Serratia ureilytica]
MPPSYCRALSTAGIISDADGITPAWRLGIGVDWFFMLVLVALLLALAAIDNQCQLLPDCLTPSLLWIGLLWHCWRTRPFAGGGHWRDGGLSGALAIVLGFRLATGREGLGYGD